MKKKLFKFIMGLLEITIFFSALGTILAVFEKFSWILALFANLRLQYLLAFIVSGIVINLIAKFILKEKLSKTNKSIVLISFLGIIINLVSMVDISFNMPVKHGDEITVASLNVYTQNTRYSEVVSYIKNNNIDIIVLLEINSQWVNNLKSLNNTYQYSIINPQEDNFGIVLLSKFPIKKYEIKYFSGVPSIYAEILLPNTEVSIIGTHPLPPISEDYSKMRNTHLEKMAEFIQSKKMNKTVLLGDLNTTPWSFYLKNLKDKGNLRDTNNGIFRATWNKYNLLFAIPIDYILTTKDIELKTFMIGSSIGSDHSLVKAKIKVPILNQ